MAKRTSIRSQQLLALEAGGVHILSVYKWVPQSGTVALRSCWEDAPEGTPKSSAAAEEPSMFRCTVTRPAAPP